MLNLIVHEDPRARTPLACPLASNIYGTIAAALVYLARAGLVIIFLSVCHNSGRDAARDFSDCNSHRRGLFHDRESFSSTTRTAPVALLKEYGWHV